MKRFSTIIFLAAAFWIVAVPPAHAYIDAGSGSYIFQILIGSLLAVGVGIKVFWRHVRSLFGARPGRKQKETSRGD